MRWSKIKQRAESFLCEKFQGRLQIYLTSYDKFHRDEGRGWITFDGNEIYQAAGQDRRQQFYETIVGYPNVDVGEALRSEDPLLRLLAVCDRRVGRTRLEKIAAGKTGGPILMLVEERLKKDSNP